MTPTHAIQTALEFIVCGIAIYGLINERKIAVIEHRIFRRIKRKILKCRK